MPIFGLFALVPLTPGSHPAHIRRTTGCTGHTHPAHTRHSTGRRSFSPFGQGGAQGAPCMFLGCFFSPPQAPTSHTAHIRQLQPDTRQPQPTHTRHAPGRRRFSPFGQGVAQGAPCMFLGCFFAPPQAPTSHTAHIRQLQPDTRQPQPTHTRHAPGRRRFSPFGQGDAKGVAQGAPCIF
jgi:hypothetical protein